MGPLERWGRPVAVGVSALILFAGALLFTAAATGRFGQYWGYDVGHYLDGARRFLDTGTPYLPNEVAGPFEYAPETFLHPPIALLLFVPFLWLPIILWWVIPLGTVAWCAWSWRPAYWAWPTMAFAVAYTRFHDALIVGNSDLWVWAGVAAGLRFGWPAIVVVVKPSLGPLVLAGARHRSWWLAAFVVLVASLPFWTLWVDWLRVVRNSPADFSYSLPNLPYLVMPIIWWAARRRPEAPTARMAVPA